MTDEIQLTEQDEADLRSLGLEGDGREAPSERSLLEIWSAVLDSVESVAAEKIPFLVAHKTVTTWPKISYQDTAIYHKRYHELLGQLRAPLRELIAAHPDALKHTGEADGELNHDHYLNLLVGWNLALDAYEQAWDAEDPESHILGAVFIDVRAFFFSEMGLAGQLGAIGLVLEDDEFLTALNAAKEAQ